MATLDRNYSLYSETRESSLEKYNEWGLDYMCSNKVKPTRDNVDLAKIRKK